MAAMTVRQKREWSKRIVAKQEAVEAALDELYEEIIAAHKAGMSPYAISQPLGSTAVTVNKILAGGRPSRYGS